jgi:hypothetical protein
MYLKPVECSSHIFFGVYSHQGEISNILHIHKMKQEEFYHLIDDAGLEYIQVGDEKRSREFIIGKRISYKREGFVTKLVFSNENMSLEYMDGTKPNIKLTKEEEMEINSKILKLGFFTNTDYYLINSYQSNLIK